MKIIREINDELIVEDKETTAITIGILMIIFGFIGVLMGFGVELFGPTIVSNLFCIPTIVFGAWMIFAAKQHRVTFKRGGQTSIEQKRMLLGKNEEVVITTSDIREVSFAGGETTAHTADGHYHKSDDGAVTLHLGDGAFFEIGGKLFGGTLSLLGKSITVRVNTGVAASEGGIIANFLNVPLRSEPATALAPSTSSSAPSPREPRLVEPLQPVAPTTASPVEITPLAASMTPPTITAPPEALSPSPTSISPPTPASVPLVTPPSPPPQPSIDEIQASAEQVASSVDQAMARQLGEQLPIRQTDITPSELAEERAEEASEIQAAADAMPAPQAPDKPFIYATAPPAPAQTVQNPKP